MDFSEVFFLPQEQFSDQVCAQDEEEVHPKAPGLCHAGYEISKWNVTFQIKLDVSWEGVMNENTEEREESETIQFRAIKRLSPARLRNFTWLNWNCYRHARENSTIADAIVLDGHNKNKVPTRRVMQSRSATQRISVAAEWNFISAPSYLRWTGTPDKSLLSTSSNRGV